MRIIKPLLQDNSKPVKKPPIKSQPAPRPAPMPVPRPVPRPAPKPTSKPSKPVRDIGTGSPVFSPKDIPIDPRMVRNADYNAGAGAMGGGTPAGTLSPRGAVTGGAMPAPPMGGGIKKGGSVRAEKMASGGMTSKASSASKRGDGIAQRGKTKGRMV